MKVLTKRRKNLLLIFASIASIYFIIKLRYESPSTQFGKGSADSLPQWMLIGATVENFNADGLLSSRLQSDSTEFFAHSNSVSLTKPILQYYAAEKILWQAQADSGLSKNNMTSLVLSGSVIVNHQKRTQTIATEQLSSDFNKSLLTTDKAVTITSPNAVATAAGMESNWRNNTLKLLNDVHVQITPQR